MPKEEKLQKDDFVNNEDRIECASITDEEIEEWIVTTRKVLILLKEENNKVYEKVYQEFILDVQLLLDNSRITEIDYEEIVDKI